jgi:NADPH-dependent 2,4-dienoyl-CoA reductase/sulfur reductase-like enzyme
MHHVIIGGGPAAINAVETIREFDDGRSAITLVSDEPAYSRMALPYWLAGSIAEAQTHTGDAAYFARLGVTTRFGVRVAAIDPRGKSVSLSDGGRLDFDDLLIATGSSPIRSTIEGADLPGVEPLWTLAHAGRVLAQAAALQPAGRAPRVVLVGAGFIGFIVLNAMYKRKWSLAVVEREAHVLPRMLDATAADHAQRWLAACNVPVHCGVELRRIRQQRDGTKVVELSNGRSLDADIVILATGVRPNLDLLQGSGIPTREGIVVDDRMRTLFPHVYAAGDVAEGPVLSGGGNAVHAIQPTAVDHGRVAGANMAGREVRYPGSLSMNVVDICGLQGASFGDWNDAGAEATTIDNGAGFIHRKLIWSGDRISGAIFVGRADDLGMLTDVGMVKGLMQTRMQLGPWKKHLQDHPFDVRRAYVGCGTAARLVGATLLDRPSRARGFRFGSAEPNAPTGPSHAVFVAGR